MWVSCQCSPLDHVDPRGSVILVWDGWVRSYITALGHERVISEDIVGGLMEIIHKRFIKLGGSERIRMSCGTF